MDVRNPGALVRIDSHGLTTEELLGQVLIAFNMRNRATFLCPAGQGPSAVQRLRMKLSRVRAGMDSKGIPRTHFRMGARVFPYTNRAGIRYDCVVLESIRTVNHQISETVERIVKNADVGGPHGQANPGPSQQGGFDW